MQNEMKEQNTVQEFTYLSKTNISQTVLFLKEAQSYLQQQYTKELFEQPTKEDFLATTNAIYYENYILNEFVKALKECETSIEQAIGFYTQMQQTFHFQSGFFMSFFKLQSLAILL